MYVEIYSDVVCPWCYIGERRFKRALAAYPHANDVEVVFRPFQLDPTVPDRPQPLKQYLSKKFGADTDAVTRRTASAAAEEGLDLHFDDALAVNTFAAHRLMYFALQEAGPDVQRELAELLFEAHFTKGLNIADQAVLAGLAAEAGLDRKGVETYLASDEGVEEVEDEIAEAQRLGIRAVPTFVFNGESALQGALPSSTFLAVLEEIGSEAAASQDAQTCADDACIS